MRVGAMEGAGGSEGDEWGAMEGAGGCEGDEWGAMGRGRRALTGWVGYFFDRPWGGGVFWRRVRARRRWAIAVRGFSIAVMRAVRAMIQMSGLCASRGRSAGGVGSMESVGWVVVSFIGYTCWVLVDESG